MTRGGAPEGAPADGADQSDLHSTRAVRRDKFAMVPESLIVGSLPGVNRTHAGCVLLFARLDLEQGPRGNPARNLTRLAESLGVQPRTISRWAQPLAEAGLVKIEQEGSEAATIRILSNPARERTDDTPLEPADRRVPPKAGTRSGHRGRRGAGRTLPAARSSRELAADTATRTTRAGDTALAREERTRTARRTRAPVDALPREERAAASVSEGVSRSEDPSHARAVALLKRDLGAVIEDQRFLCTCGEPADGQPGLNGEPYCILCEVF